MPLPATFVIGKCQDIVWALETGRAFLEADVTTVRDAGGTPAGIKRAFAATRTCGDSTR